jgi:hypothetical protein
VQEEQGVAGRGCILDNWGPLDASELSLHQGHRPAPGLCLQEACDLLVLLPCRQPQGTRKETHPKTPIFLCRMEQAPQFGLGKAGRGLKDTAGSGCHRSHLPAPLKVGKTHRPPPMSPEPCPARRAALSLFSTDAHHVGPTVRPQLVLGDPSVPLHMQLQPITGAPGLLFFS